jgi:hypothetical protein
MRDNLNLPLANLLDLDIIAQITRASFNLNAIVQEFLKRTDIENLVRHRLAAVDRVLGRDLRGFAAFLCGAGLEIQKGKP